MCACARAVFSAPQLFPNFNDVHAKAPTYTPERVMRGFFSPKVFGGGSAQVRKSIEIAISYACRLGARGEKNVPSRRNAIAASDECDRVIGMVI